MSAFELNTLRAQATPPVMPTIESSATTKPTGTTTNPTTFATMSPTTSGSAED